MGDEQGGSAIPVGSGRVLGFILKISPFAHPVLVLSGLDQFCAALTHADTLLEKGGWEHSIQAIPEIQLAFNAGILHQ